MPDIGARPKSRAPRNDSTLQTSADSETGAGVDINKEIPHFDQSEVDDDDDDDDESDVGQTDLDIDDTVLRGTCIVNIDKGNMSK